MKQGKLTWEQIAFTLRLGERGVPFREACRKLGVRPVRRLQQPDIATWHRDKSEVRPHIALGSQASHESATSSGQVRVVG